MQIKLKYSTLKLFPYLSEILPCAAFTTATECTVSLFHRFVSRWLMIRGVGPVACCQICHVMFKLWNSSACWEKCWCRASENRSTICLCVSGRFSCRRGESQVTAGAQTWRPQSPFFCRKRWSRHEKDRGEREEKVFCWCHQVSSACPSMLLYFTAPPAQTQGVTDPRPRLPRELQQAGSGCRQGQGRRPAAAPL